MAVSTKQYQRLLARLTALEEHANDIATAIDSLVTMQEVRQLLVVLQTDLEDVQTNVDALEARVTLIEEEPLT